MNTKHHNPNRNAWAMVRAHARMHRTGQVPKAGLNWLVGVARCANATNPVAMAKAARMVWP